MSETSQRSLWKRYRSIPVFYRIMVALVLGAAVGLVVGEPAGDLKPLGDVLVRLLKMLVVPIVFLTLVMGMRRINPAQLGVVGTQTVLAYVATTAIAIGFGLVVGNLFNPGVGVTIPEGTEPMTKETPELVDVFLNIFPANPVASLAEGNVLQIIFFSIIFGIGLTLVRDEAEEDSVAYRGATALFDMIEAAAEVLFKIVWGVMEYAVIGVFALMAWAFGVTGTELLMSFGLLIVALAVAIALHIAVTYLLVVVMVLQRESPLDFLRGGKEAITTAFAIRSSSGTLPITMSDADENLRIDEEIYSFTLPLGATINMDGTAMYQGITAIFAANIVGVSLSISDQLVVLLTALLASVGTAGVPGSGLIMLTMVLTQLGFPLEIIGFVAGIDPILDRMRTLNNVTGDLAVSTLVAKWNDAIDYTTGSWGD
jgi:Na+/H+-dicarboxylate symporter